MMKTVLSIIMTLSLGFPFFAEACNKQQCLAQAKTNYDHKVEAAREHEFMNSSERFYYFNGLELEYQSAIQHCAKACS
jgi:hypothetical protein